MAKLMTKEQIAEFIKENNVTDGKSLEDAFAERFKDVLQAILEAGPYEPVEEFMDLVIQRMRNGDEDDFYRAIEYLDLVFSQDYCERDWRNRIATVFLEEIFKNGEPDETGIGDILERMGQHQDLDWVLRGRMEDEIKRRGGSNLTRP